MRKTNKITPSDLLSLNIRYENTKWAREDQERVGHLVRRMSLLEKEEKELIIKLTDQFCYIDYSVIPLYLEKTFKNFLSSSQCYKFIIAPLKSPFLSSIETDTVGRKLTQKTKSSDLCYTIFKNTFIKSKYPKGLHFCFCDTPQDIKQNFKNTYKIAFIDDFIGSGETAGEKINEYLSYFQWEVVNVNASQLCIVVIIAMKEGIDYINSHIKKVNSYCYLSKQKGITGSPDLNTKSNVDLMKSIENKVLQKLNRKFSFGYKSSESLVSIMEKSPNNTFPFYWYKGKDGQNGELEPIFRRNIE